MWQTIRQLNNFPQIAPPDTLFHIATASLTLNRIVKEQLRKTEEILIFRLLLPFNFYQILDLPGQVCDQFLLKKYQLGRV